MSKQEDSVYRIPKDKQLVLTSLATHLGAQEGETQTVRFIIVQNCKKSS